jgi:ribosomal-protein-alanine N-acetyltransferase
VSLPAGYEVRPLAREDAAPLAAAYVRNHDHLAPWDPVRPPSYYTGAGQAESIAERLAEVADGRAASWLLWCGDEVVGRVNLQNVVRSVFRSASLGYWVDARHQGRGLATAAVEHACEHALADGLHRVEASTLLHNAASQRVLGRAGFARIGTADRYLFIAGLWQDHALFHRILHDRPL